MASGIGCVQLASFNPKGVSETGGDRCNERIIETILKAEGSLFSVAGCLASSGRRLRLRLAERWPWTGELTAAAARLQALPSG